MGSAHKLQPCLCVAWQKSVVKSERERKRDERKRERERENENSKTSFQLLAQTRTKGSVERVKTGRQKDKERQRD